MSRDREKKLTERALKTRAAAHERIIKNATIQFRLDANNMEKILRLADDKKMGVGVLARMWVIERLHKELGIINQEALANQSLSERLAQLQTQIDSLSKIIQSSSSKRAKAS